jgi:hypothetical protein
MARRELSVRDIVEIYLSRPGRAGGGSLEASASTGTP